MVDSYTFAQGMKTLAIAFRTTLAPEEYELYQRTICPHIDNDAFLDAIETCVHTGQHFPRISAVLKAAGGKARGSRTWGENAAGSSPSDADRPRRLAEFLLDARSRGDDAGESYYRELIDRMAGRDREQARAMLERGS